MKRIKTLNHDPKRIKGELKVIEVEIFNPFNGKSSSIGGRVPLNGFRISMKISLNETFILFESDLKVYYFKRKQFPYLIGKAFHFMIEY